MRILVADQNAMLLAAIASTFGRHCVVVTATRRETCLEHLAQEPFDVVVACERLHDCTGLELLSEIETLAPQTLCIFSASAPRLAQMQSQLDHFRLLGTLSYPIDARKLLLALKVARTKLPSRAARPKVRHVVLESEWDTGERLGILERELEVEPAEPPTLAAAPTPAPTRARPNIPVASIPTVGTASARKPESRPAPAAALEADDIPILDNVEETSVRWVNKSPPAERPFEVSYDENPNRRKATAALPQVTATPARGAPAAPARVAGPPNSRPTQNPSRPPNAQVAAGQPAPTGRSVPKAHAATSPARSAHSVSAGQPELASDTNAEETIAPSFDVMAASLGAPANDPSVEPPPPPPPPPVDTGGAANEPMFGADKAGKGSAKTAAGKSADDDSDPQKSSAQSSGRGNSGSPDAAGTANANQAAGGAAGAKAQPGASGAKNQPAADAKKPTGAAAKTSAGATTRKAPPPQRKQAIPTAAQREAFQRARARRHALQNDFSIEADTNIPPSLQAGDTASTTPSAVKPHWHGADSLTDLARMATNKRPLAQTQAKFAPKRNVVMVGSGVAAVVLASVLAFQLTRSHAPTHHNRQTSAAQLFTPGAGEAAQNAGGPPPEVFGPPPGQTQRVANAADQTTNLPQPQSFDPNTAPDDPPPPPALEHPGPTEPPSMGHYEQPPGSD